MTSKEHQGDKQARERQYGWDTPEFSRVVNLSDAVFAIAMTLLVLTLDRPDVPATQLAGALAGQLTQIIAFLLSFALVANLWWHHHKFIQLLGFLEPGLISLNLVLLGAVVLVPFPTSLIGNAPAAHAAVLPFIALFALISVMFLLMLMRVRAVEAWRRPITLPRFYWLLSTYASGIFVLLLAFVLALWWPVVGLIVLALSMILGPFAARSKYME